MSSIDFTSVLGQRVLHQLETEEVVWLTTVSPKGRPQPSPVWFIWRDGEIIIFSEPGAPKVRNIGNNPHVALSFNTDEEGDRVTIFQAEARLQETPLTGADIEQFPDYVEKYRAGLARLNMNPDTMLGQYSQVIIITPTSLRGW